MAVNYNDERFKEVETEKKEALTELEQTYGGMVKESDQYYQAQIDASKQWEATQKANQQAQTDFAIEKIEQQKDQTTKDYTKEQSGAYVDWQKESNRYGANAEAMASQGLINTGYGESSQVRMYNTYQNRVATARESYNLAIMNYNNAIKDAQLQNNSALAEIAYTALQQQLELSLQGFQYKNQLILEQASKKKELEDTYHERYQDVLAQINQENALAEQIRQYNESLAEEKRQFNEQMAEDKRRYEASLSASSGGSSGGSARISKASGAESAGAAAFRETVSGKYLSTPASQKLLATKQAATQARAKTASQSGRTHSGSSARISNGVKTDYYQGAKNSDADRYGTFNNGYQPKGISGYGAVSKTGDTVTFTTQTLAGKTVKVKQNVWKTVDGSLWYWDGRYNKYIKVK
jgi:hypothetical protein